MKKAIPVLLALLVLISTFQIYLYFKDSKTTERDVILYKMMEEREILLAKEPPIKIKLESSQATTYDFKPNFNKTLVEEIPNYVGWVKIPGTPIDYPLVKTNNNDFYLDHGYQQEKNIAGAIFMDRRNLGNRFDQHTILYGHLMKDGSMFSALNCYEDIHYYNNNKVIFLKNLYTEESYEIFSVYKVSADDFTLAFDLSLEKLQAFRDRSMHEINMSFAGDEKILTLSTCNYDLNNGRMIIHATRKASSTLPFYLLVQWHIRLYKT